MTAPEDRRSEPAADLGAVWDALDSLPRATASAALAATTVELAAVRVAAAAPAAAGSIRRWLLPGVVLAAALVVGLITGRATAPDPDRQVLRDLPLIEHLGLLEEAGSIEFLEALATRIDDGQDAFARRVRWLREQGGRGEAREFDDELALLEGRLGRGDPDAEALAQRRQRVATLAAADREAIEKAAEMFAKLTEVDRRRCRQLAAALVDPAQRRLRDAARLWHVFVAAVPPPLRRGHVAMTTAERLESLERLASERRGPGRDELRPDRRPPGMRDVPGMPGPWRRPDGRADGRPEPSGPPPDRPVRPDRPRPAFPADAGETPPPPR